MHILITADTLGGVWTYTQELVSGLIQRGNQVTLVSFGALPKAEQLEWMRGVPRLDYRPTAFRLEWMQDSKQDIEASVCYLERVIAEVRPDLLHSSQYCYGEVSCSIPKVLVAHSDVVSWWVGTHGALPPDSSWLRWYREKVIRGIECADVVIAPSKWMLDAICEHYLSPLSKLVVHNGRTPESFLSDEKKRDFVLSVGRLWDKAKQVDLLLNEDCGVSLCIVGSFKEPGTINSAAPKSSPNTNVRLHNSKAHSELRKLFGEAAIYAATSRYEPFGLAPLEAAFSRCAIVANDIPVFRELWGDAACYFEANSASDLSMKLQVLMNDADLRRSFGDASYCIACKRFTAEQMVQRYLDVYMQAVSLRSAA